MPTTSPRVNRLTLREQVLENLRTAIVSGELRPGAPLTETELAERYEVSRGTVREALRTLQTAGLVAGGPRGAQHVHVPGAEEIREVFAVRAALEQLAVREVIGSDRRGEHAAALRAALPPQSPPASFGDALEADLAFHELLCRLSGNIVLLRTWQRLEDQMRVVLLSAGYDEPLDLMGRAHHEPVVDAIEAGDVTTATGLIAEHMSGAAVHWSAGRD